MKNHDPKRRAVLLGTIAAGATLVLYGCKGKQEEAAQADTEPSAAAPSEQSDERRLEDGSPTAKMSQEGAQYQTEPLDGRKCANCANFIAESNSCKVVEGEISPEGWCILWTQA